MPTSRCVALYCCPAAPAKTVRILVFAEGDAAKIAEEAGADFVGSDELVNKIQGGWTDFDMAIATPPMMKKVGRLGRVLGPRGLMPSPKAGTIVEDDDLPRVIQEARQGRVEFKVDKTANIHVPLGQNQLHRRAIDGKSVGRHGSDHQRQAVGRQGHLHQAGDPDVDHGPWHQDRCQSGGTIADCLSSRLAWTAVRRSGSVNNRFVSEIVASDSRRQTVPSGMAHGLNHQPAEATGSGEHSLAGHARSGRTPVVLEFHLCGDAAKLTLSESLRIG